MSNIYNDSVLEFGPIHQTLQIAEELSELSKELIKAVNSRLWLGRNYNKDIPVDMLEKIAEEWADVEIVMQYMPIIFGNSGMESKKNSIKEKKLIRLARLIEEARTDRENE